MDAFRQQIGREQVAATRFRGDDGGIIADAPENSRAIASIPSLQRSNEVKLLMVEMALRRGRDAMLPEKRSGMEASWSCVGCPLGPPRFVNRVGGIVGSRA